MGSYFYPKEDGQGDISDTSRPLKEGEIVCGFRSSSNGRILIWT